MISIDFTRTRAQATRDTQVILAAPPTSWPWSQKTVAQWDADLAALDTCIADESARRTQWRIGRQMIRKLKVYAGPEHPHGSQHPQPIELASARAR